MKMRSEGRVRARLAESAGSVAAAAIVGPRAWAALWAVAVGATSILYLLPNTGPPGQLQLDKLAHLAAFGAIGLSSYLSAARRRPNLPMLVSVVLAVLLEWLQGYVPGREYSLVDCGANLVGTAAGFAAAGAFRALVARRPGSSV